MNLAQRLRRQIDRQTGLTRSVLEDYRAVIAMVKANARLNIGSTTYVLNGANNCARMPHLAKMLNSNGFRFVWPSDSTDENIKIIISC